MKKWIAVISVAVGAGCAGVPSHKTTWLKKDGTTTADQQERDYRQCEYEAALHARSTTPGLQTIVGVEYDRLQNRKDLINLCMAARDYYIGRVPVSGHGIPQK